MRWPPARLRTLTLMALALGLFPWTARTSALGQEATRPAARDADAESEKRIEDLGKTIGQHLDAGRIAEAIPPAREKLDLVVRLRGKEHWQTGDARRDLETFKRLAARPRGPGSVRGGASRDYPRRSALRPGAVRPSVGARSGNPRDLPRGPGRGTPGHRHELRLDGRDPRGPGEVCRRRGDGPPRPGDPPEGRGRGTPRHRHQLRPPGLDPYGPGEAGRAPRRCSAAPWRSA